MGMDSSLIIGGAAGLVGGHAQRLTTPEDETQKSQLQFLMELRDIMSDMHDFFKQQTLPERFDFNWIQVLFKVGQGSNWIPRKNNNQYFRVWAPVATALLVSSPVGAPFILTIPAITATYPNMWLPFDFPDGSSISLDVSATSNQMNIYVKLTDVAQE